MPAFLKLTHDLHDFADSLPGAQCRTLLRLLRYEYSGKWPLQSEMAAAMNMSTRTFERAIKILVESGLVISHIDQAPTTYSFTIPNGVMKKVAVYGSNENCTKIADGNKELFKVFCERAHEGLAAIQAENEFGKLFFADAELAVSKIKSYSTIYASASMENRRYFNRCRSWIAGQCFRLPDSVWRERAGATTHASGITDVDLNFGENQKVKVNR